MGSAGFGGGNDLTIGVGADVRGAQQGMSQAAQSVSDFADTVTRATAQMQASLAQLTTSFNTLNTSLSQLKLGQENVGKQAEDTAGKLNNNLFSKFGAWNIETAAVINNFRTLTSVLGGVMNVVTALPRAIMSIPFDFLQQNLGLPSLGAMPMAALNESFGLNVTTEKALGAWRFLYGKGGQEKPTAVDPTVANLMNWTSTYSMAIPYTRQDLIQAITALGRMGLSAADVKQFMPAVADLGVLNPDRNLTQAAFAIQGAMHGYTRMLRYDYGIDPRQLAKYGLQISGMDHVDNPDQLLPALARYEAARGLTGSAQYAATSTWWGGLSSLKDRVQNLLLEMGGTETSTTGTTAAGTIRPGSLFGRMKEDLVGLSKWMDTPANRDQLFKWADALQNVLGASAKIAGNAVTGLFHGFQESGVGNVIFDGLKNFGTWINDPNTTRTVQEIGVTLGKFLGPGLQTAGGALQGFISGLASSGVGPAIGQALDGLGKWFADPQHQQDIKNFTTALGDLTGHVVTFTAQLAQATGNFVGSVGGFLSGASDAISHWMVGMEVSGMSTADLKKLVQTNPYGKGVTSTERDLIMQAEGQLLMQQYGPSNLKEIIAAYANWQQQEAALANATYNDPTGGRRKFGTVGGQVGGMRGDNALDSYLSGQGMGKNDYSKSGQDNATSYIQAFHNQLAKTDVTTSFVTQLKTQLTTGLTSHSGEFVAGFSAFVQTIAEQVVGAALASASQDANTTARRPGGQRAGIFIGGY